LEANFEREQSRANFAALELANVRQEIERRVQEKEEEFESTRRNHGRAMESMQASVDAEVKSKAEALRQRKKLENDVNSLEVSLDHSNRVNAELQKSVKKLQQQLTEQQIQIGEEQKVGSLCSSADG
jgi:chromosome segregation ATPase